MGANFSIGARLAAGEVGGSLLSYQDTLERLVEAFGFLLRMPDRERGYLGSAGVSSIWREVHLTKREAWALYRIDSDDYDRDAKPKLPGLSVGEVARMEEAFAWIDAAALQKDRRLLGLALHQLQRQDRPGWKAIAAAMADESTPDALRMRFDQAVGAVCRHANRQKS